MDFFKSFYLHDRLKIYVRERENADNTNLSELNSLMKRQKKASER